MTIEIGMKVIHPLYPHWGEGTILDFVEGDPVVEFEERSGRPTPFSLENLQDQDGHSLTRLIPKPPTKAQLRQAAKDRAAAAKIEKEEREKAEHEELIKNAVDYLVSLGDQVTLDIASARSQEQIDELVAHCARYGLELRTRLEPNRWGVGLKITFPILPDNPPPFPVRDGGYVGHRGCWDRLKPQALFILHKGAVTRYFQLANTEVVLQLIEKGLRYKETQRGTRG